MQGRNPQRIPKNVQCRAMARDGSRGRPESRNGSDLVIGGMPFLLFPTSIDRRTDNIMEIRRVNSTDEEDWEVMLDGGEFCIINAGLFDKSFRSFVEINAHRIKPQLGLSIQPLGPLPGLVNNPMFQGFHAPLSAGLVLICQDGPVKQVSKAEMEGLQNGACLHAGTMAFIVCHHNKAPEPLIESPSVLLEANLMGHHLAFWCPSAQRLAPENLEDLELRVLRMLGTTV